jgi:hypothetical protein
MTSTVPGWIEPDRMAAIAPSSPSNTRAVPTNCFCSALRPATFTTAPLGASEPVSTTMPPSLWIGLLQRVHHHAVGRGRVDVGQVLGHGLAGDGEAVAVQQPASSRCLSTTGTPPTRSRSLMWNLPPGFMSAMCGTLAAMRLKSSSSSSTPASLAMASRCSTALVLPPSAEVTAMAFSNAFLVMIMRGVMPRRSRLTTASPAIRASLSRRPSMAGGDAVPGSDMPIASAMLLIVLAVNMPPHAPSPGHALRSISPSSSSVILPSAHAPTASNTLVMSVACRCGARHGAAVVDEHAGQVEAGRRHQHAGDALVAPGQADEAVEPLGVHHALHGVGDDLAADTARRACPRGPC